MVVASTTLRGGMLYVGSRMADAAGVGIEPALIDPNLRIDQRNPDWPGESMDYWPSYSDISPGARAAYLAWLVGGRANANTYIGYVFLYFYGLERRLLTEVPDLDEPAAAEYASLVAEVRRLLDVYGANRSFRGYATKLLHTVEILDPTVRYDRAAPPVAEWSHELPMDLRVGLAQLAVTGHPVPADWALSWYGHHPDTYLRTPAVRCPNEFLELFTKRYRARFGDGLIVKPNKPRLSVDYDPASGGFHGSVALTNSALPDIAKLTGPITKLRDLVDEVTGDLEPYSRYLGRHPDGAGSPAAIALLPPGVSHKPNPQTEALWSWAAQSVDGPGGVVSARELISRWPASTGKLTKSDAVAVAQLLEQRGLGIEPDVRFGGNTPTPTSSIVLFRRAANAVSAPSTDYAAALAVVNLGILVAVADGTVSEPERRVLRELAIEDLDLSEDERLRLDAHAALVLTKPPTPAALRRRLEALSMSRKAAVGRLLTTIAAADGQITPDEVRTLERLTATLGLDPGEVYGTLHAAATTVDDLTPVVIPGEQRAGRKVPAAPPQRSAGATLALDPEKLARTRAESAMVAAELAEIFTEDAEPDPLPPLPSHIASVGGLDAAHTQLFHLLVERETWSRAEFDALATTTGLLPDGALEVLNEAAYDIADEPLCEGSDPIEINHDIVKDML